VSVASPSGSVPSGSIGSQSVSAALADAINADTGFGIGGGLNLINPAGSLLLAQYPWLGFQPQTS
jgi:hypothetical protein